MFRFSKIQNGISFKASEGYQHVIPNNHQTDTPNEPMRLNYETTIQQPVCNNGHNDRHVLYILKYVHVCTCSK